MSIRAADAGTCTKSTKIALVAVWVVAGGAILATLIQLSTTLTGRFIFFFWEPDTRMPITALPQMLRADVHFDADGYGTDVPSWIRVLCATPTATNTMTVLPAAIFVAGIIRKIALGQPFDKKLIRNWKSLGLAFVIGGTIQGVLDTAAGQSLMGAAGVTHADGDFEVGAEYTIPIVNSLRWPLFLMLTGVIAAALAIAFFREHGRKARLKELSGSHKNEPDTTPGEEHLIECHVGEVLIDRGMTLPELSRRTGITMENLSILKTNKAKAVRFTTLRAICKELNATPAELFTIRFP